MNGETILHYKIVKKLGEDPPTSVILSSRGVS